MSDQTLNACMKPSCKHKGQEVSQYVDVDPVNKDLLLFWKSLPLSQRGSVISVSKKSFFEQLRKRYCSRCFGHFQSRYGKLKNKTRGLGCCPSGISFSNALVVDDGGALSLEDSILEDQPFEIFSAVKAQDRERLTDVPTTACGSGYRRRNGPSSLCSLHTAPIPCEVLLRKWKTLSGEQRNALLAIELDEFKSRLQLHVSDVLRVCHCCRSNIFDQMKKLKPMKLREAEKGLTEDGLQICSGIRLLVEEGLVKLKSTSEGDLDDLAPLFETAARAEFWNGVKDHSSGKCSPEKSGKPCSEEGSNETTVSDESEQRSQHAETPAMSRAVLGEAAAAIFKGQIESTYRKELAEDNTLWLFPFFALELMEMQLLNAYNDGQAKKAEKELLQQLSTETRAGKKRSRKHKSGMLPGTHSAVASSTRGSRTGSVEGVFSGNLPAVVQPDCHMKINQPVPQENSEDSMDAMLREQVCGSQGLDPGAAFVASCDAETSDEGWEVMAGKNRRSKAKSKQKDSQEWHGEVPSEKSSVTNMSSPTTTRASSPDSWASAGTVSWRRVTGPMSSAQKRETSQANKEVRLRPNACLVHPVARLSNAWAARSPVQPEGSDVKGPTLSPEDFPPLSADMTLKFPRPTPAKQDGSAITTNYCRDPIAAAAVEKDAMAWGSPCAVPELDLSHPPTEQSFRTPSHALEREAGVRASHKFLPCLHAHKSGWDHPAPHVVQDPRLEAAEREVKARISLRMQSQASTGTLQEVEGRQGGLKEETHFCHPRVPLDDRNEFPELPGRSSCAEGMPAPKTQQRGSIGYTDSASLHSNLGAFTNVSPGSIGVADMSLSSCQNLFQLSHLESMLLPSHPPPRPLSVPEEMANAVLHTADSAVQVASQWAEPEGVAVPHATLHRGLLSLREYDFQDSVHAAICTGSPECTSGKFSSLKHLWPDSPPNSMLTESFWGPQTSNWGQIWGPLLLS